MAVASLPEVRCFEELVLMTPADELPVQCISRSCVTHSVGMPGAEPLRRSKVTCENFRCLTDASLKKPGAD